MYLAASVQELANLVPDPSPLSPGLSAQVNATILSIFAAGLTAYLLHARQTVLDRRSRAVAVASRINQHPTQSGYHEDATLPAPHGPADQAGVQELLSRFKQIASREGEWESKDPSVRGHELLRTWSRVAKSYPFPPRVLEAGDDESVEYFDGTVTLSGTDELESWIESAESVSTGILSSLRSHESKISEDLVALEDDQPEFVSEDQLEELKAKLSPGEFDDMQRLMTLARPEKSLQHLHGRFLEQTKVLSDLAEEARGHLHAAQQLDSALPSKATLVLSSLALALSFLCGVGAPLVFATVPALVYVGIPLAIYLLAVAAIVTLAARGFPTVDRSRERS